MKYAIIKDEKVLNIIEADEANAETIAASMGAVAVQSDIAGIGQNYIDGVFSDSDPAVIPDSATVIALKTALAAEIASLNTDYPELALTIDDTIVTAIPKLFSAGVTKAEATYLFTLYSAIEKAQTQK